MRTHTETLLTLYEWARLLGFSSWELAQIAGTGRGACAGVWYQYAWQHSGLSRDELGQAIARAEEMIAQALGYYPAPKYIENDILLYPRGSAAMAGRWFSNRNHWADYKAIQTNFGYVQGGGKRVRAAINEDVTVVLQDLDRDECVDNFKVSFATSVTSADELALYFHADDRMGEAVGEAWRVRPVTVTISEGVATMTGPSVLIVNPTLQDRPEPEELDRGDNHIYVNHLAAYRVYRDATHTEEAPAQGVAMWERAGCVEGVDGDCLQAVAPVCIGDRDGGNGLVYVQYSLCEIEADLGYREPNRLNLNYLAGHPLTPNGRMNPVMADIVAHLSAALLPSSDCGCDRTSQILEAWRGTPNASGENARPYADDELNNPFGVEAGAVWAWRRVRNLMRVDGVLV